MKTILLLSMTCLCKLIAAHMYANGDGRWSHSDHYHTHNHTFSHIAAQPTDKEEMETVFKALKLPLDFAHGLPKHNHFPGHQHHKVNYHSPVQFQEYYHDYRIPHSSPNLHSGLAQPNFQQPPFQAENNIANVNNVNDVDVEIRNQLITASQSSTNIFGRLVRLILGISNQTLSSVRPLIVGFVENGAKATRGVAQVTSHVAQRIPLVAGASADLIRNVGDAGARFLQDISQLILSTSSVNLQIAEQLPNTFDLISETGEQLVTSLGTIFQGLADSTNVITTGVLDTVKIKGNLATRLVGGILP